ncbi:dihydrolipoyl dehydrogenase family protein [Salidesulfovibrio brasiliensis]|uniref:dihydrolipoyl dehydrogenase family protein n=1 Tax=Salidesulfovibrio brasiliensis TaxID=221711 RepID=UPI0006CFEC1C|nr:NAD(P)/FAD-dependent oxidoreductase [Salidesulfovibrio brasiliensis]
MKHYDLIVIGAGPAGGGVAAPMAEAGKRVVMFEHNGVGGVCPLRGCNPKKALLSAPEAVHAATHLKNKGVRGNISADWKEMARFKDSFVEPVPEKAAAHYRDLGIELIETTATLTGPNTVEADGETYTAENICICTGCIPHELDIPGTGFLLDSDDFLDLKELPRNLVFIGGGFIAMEFAHIAARCGSSVTMLLRGDRALRDFDKQLVEELVDASRSEGITIHFNAPITSVEQRGPAYAVMNKGEDPEIIADAVINCSGRVPAIGHLNLEAANVRLGKNGIAVNEKMQSVSNANIYAIGDVADTPYGLTPTAVLEARAAVAAMQGDDSAAADYTGIPSACYSMPPLARVGMLESEAREQGYDIRIAELDLADSFSWKRLGETHGRSRVIVDKKREIVLGAHIMGHHAEEIANLFALAIRHRIPVKELKETPWTYPTSGYYIQYMV